MVDFKRLRPQPNYPPYPPYHRGEYIEEYFYNFYKKNKAAFDTTNRTLVPVFWTNLYIHSFPNFIIQEYINALPEGRYFTVCQFDDGIHEQLPTDTINFVAGGNKPGIPIPLICSPIPEKYKTQVEKDLFCSFVGTCLNTDKYSCRLKLYEEYNKDKEFYFTPQRSWDRIVTEDQLKEFCNITQRSRFTLCPRGYGLQSFRLYEAMQLNSIPVFVYNEPFFPFSSLEGCDWDSFCVRVHEKDISYLKERLLAISEEEQQKLLNSGREIYKQYFTMEAMCQRILQTLKLQ